MPTARIDLVTNPLTKKRSRKVFERLGLDLSTGINIYLHHVAHHGRVPFELKLPGRGGMVRGR